MEAPPSEVVLKKINSVIQITLEVGEPVYIHSSQYLSEIRTQKRSKVFSDYLGMFEQEQKSNDEDYN